MAATSTSTRLICHNVETRGQRRRNRTWVQPPAIPTVDLAYLRAFEATGDAVFLDAATDATLASMFRRLESDGWTNCVHFDSPGAPSEIPQR